MSQADHLDLDGHLLRLLLAVAEEGSVTRAAERLGVTQSAVSHGLDRLRLIVGDKLFVRAGRGIRATAQAHVLAARARVLLDDMRSFSAAGGFEPAALKGMVTIAANDMQRDLLLPGLLQAVRGQAPGLSLRVIASGIPSLEMLRDDRCQLLVTPRPPDGSDILHKRLFEDRYVVFYDADCRLAPESDADYLAAEHVTVLYEPRRQLDIDDWLATAGVRRRFVAHVPGFGGIGPFLRGSALLATLPSLLRANLLRGFATAAVPVVCPPMPMYMVWHRRYHLDPMQRWLRELLEGAVTPALAAAALPAASTLLRDAGFGPMPVQRDEGHRDHGQAHRAERQQPAAAQPADRPAAE